MVSLVEVKDEEDVEEGGGACEAVASFRGEGVLVCSTCGIEGRGVGWQRKRRRMGKLMKMNEYVCFRWCGMNYFVVGNRSQRLGLWVIVLSEATAPEAKIGRRLGNGIMER